MLRVLNVSSGDLIGARFNGLDVIPFLEPLGIASKLTVFWKHDSDHPDVIELSPKWQTKDNKRIAQNLYGLARKLGYETLQYPWSEDLFDSDFYRSADVVHLQIIQNGTLDLNTIGRIIKEKPTVWTWHDPWPTTGHCVHPMSCSRWIMGCGSCPDLDRPFKIGKDRSSQNRKAKNNLIDANYKVHLSTDWFEDFLRKSGSIYPEPTVFPFGIDVEKFRIIDKAQARKALGIAKEDFIIGFRATEEPYKGQQEVIEAIQSKHWTNTTFVTVQGTGLDHLSTYGCQVIELGWLEDEKLLDFYNSLDVFIMPSSYETFGFMCVESMACGTPVVVGSNTPMSKHINIREAGISLESMDVSSIVGAINELRNDRELGRKMGANGHRIVQENFTMKSYAANLAGLYHAAQRDFTQ